MGGFPSKGLCERLGKRTKMQLTEEEVAGGEKKNLSVVVVSAPHPSPPIYFFVPLPQTPELPAEDSTL